ncbi:uncharacterized protein PGTG_04225 [Puccinia graminis f. sp. tritici CRL 75-36-700-3]|uniref:CCHC-type domain-containing protein n=1 Tax=Puccinia graminis f. sp. tritici (strain CRL 75-36-700-3 / race SCCL) TaxID=418459 RepID=E3K1U4_PUCGT|nr:uncharacterized protein PGTG_04225 [Puccinia graminis f. sp. tritici CRL 75-36-700-3]EFP78269.1 hypothetical protein PGTG_04225 [Puccinia graminis f. sp. tritici CRL 75-36-700-3]
MKTTICDCLLRGLDNSWKPIRDHLVYVPNEVSLDDTIGALESHELLTQVSSEVFDALVSAAKIKPKLGCWNCGQKGHHSSNCPNPSIKSKQAPQTAKMAHAGSVSFSTLGNDSEVDDENDSFDNDCDIKWG